MSRLSRRRFNRLLLGSLAIPLLAGCEQALPPSPAAPAAATPVPTDMPAPTPELSPAQQALATKIAAGPKRYLQNESKDGFYVRFYQAFEPVDPARWTLSVEGMVAKPQQMTLADLQALPLVSQTSRMACVEGWSAAAKWGGFTFKTLAERVEPDPDSTWLHIFCADGYYESLPHQELLLDRVLFVHRMNDQPLPDVHGAPLRLIVPFKYGYKGPKTITRLVFEKEQKPGYWPVSGGYSPWGNIKEGWDTPIDLKSGARRIDGDEVIYPDGLESRGA